MKKSKAVGEDCMMTELLQEGGDAILFWLEKLFNICLSELKVPNTWCNANTILLFKKGDKKDIKNYRPITLISHTHKLFIKI